MGVASLILGIFSIVFSFIPVVNWVGIILAVVGVVLGAVGRKNPAKAGVATGGLVCSIIGLVLSVILVVACGACAAALA